jgi:hypothetical protein
MSYFVDKYTLYKDFARIEPYIEAPKLNEIRQAAVRDKFGKVGFYGLTLGGLLDAMNGDNDALFDCNGETVFDLYRVAAFSVWLNEFISVVNGLTLKPTAKQIAQSSGCKQLTFEESVYYFVRSYFNLPNFDAVRELTVGDYIMAKKDDYNKAVVDRNISNSLMNK